MNLFCSNLLFSHKIYPFNTFHSLSQFHYKFNKRDMLPMIRTRFISTKSILNPLEFNGVRRMSKRNNNNLLTQKYEKNFVLQYMIIMVLFCLFLVFLNYVFIITYVWIKEEK